VTDAKECFAVGVMVIMRMRCLNARNVTQRIAIVAIALVLNVGYFPVRLVSCTIYKRGASSALSVYKDAATKSTAGSDVGIQEIEA